MESVIRNVRDIDTRERQLLEHVIGQQLKENQQVIIQVVTLGKELAGDHDRAASMLSGQLPDWCNVFAGLTDKQVAEVEEIVLQRALRGHSRAQSEGRYPPAGLTIAPLQHIIAEEITDPAEQAALDKLYRREKRKQRAAQGETAHNGPNAAKNSAPRIAPLPHVVADPITDPTEQAALDRLHKRAKRKQRQAQGKAHHNGVSAAKASAPRRR